MAVASSLKSASNAVELRPLRCLWWNVQDFAHYELPKRRLPRWPKSLKAYEEKKSRIRAVLHAAITQYGGIDVVALCELTNVAATELRDAALPDFRVLSLDNIPGNPDFHVAFLYPSNLEYERAGLFAAVGVPPSTRPMGLLDFYTDGHRIRFIAAHWTAQFDENSEMYQEHLATQLRGHIYDFLFEGGEARNRHVVVLGDLNAEPFHKVMRRDLSTTRSRARVTGQIRGADKAMQRLHLYDCGWRMLGESAPHDSLGQTRSVAGTYYLRKKRTWHTFDHMIVSGGLLKGEPPFLLESALEVFSDGLLLDPNGLPQKFSWNDGKATGISDHLPIVGTIMVKRNAEKL